jgi:uncharacterized protein (DUF305 family)
MEEPMKKVILLAAGALAFASATAYAHMHQSQQQQKQPAAQAQMHEQMKKKMQGMMPGHKGTGGEGAQDQQGAHDHGSPSAAAPAAQGSHDSHTAGAPQTTAQPAPWPKGDRGPSSLAFHGINLRMHEGMTIAFTGNADADFVNAMIPHHQGAVDMAKVVLAFGNDPEIRRLAEEIIKAQQSEIALMRAWLSRRHAH